MIEEIDSFIAKNQWFILNEDHTISEQRDVIKWSMWRKLHPELWKIRADHLEDCLISTVFLGINHNWLDQGPPLLFETMVFPDDGSFRDEYCQRCATYEQALEMHAEAIDWVKKGKPE